MEITLIYLIPISVIILVCICWYLLDRRTGVEIEEQYNRDKKRIDNITDAVKHCTDSVTECEGTTERIAQIEQRIDSKISVASESVTDAKQSGNRIERLADECLSILEEGEKTEE